jgi:hypothetical protein
MTSAQSFLDTFSAIDAADLLGLSFALMMQYAHGVQYVIHGFLFHLSRAIFGGCTLSCPVAYYSQVTFNNHQHSSA